MANYDIIGNIGIIKFNNEISKSEKLEKAQELMKQYKSLKTVVEKIDKVSGRLRTIKTKHILGEKTLIADYVENNCRFKFNIETCYFSPRLSNERMEIAKIIDRNKRKKLNILVMFAGVGPFSIIIGKKNEEGEKNKINKIVSVELGKECCRYAMENVARNKLLSLIEIIQGDVKRIIPKLVSKKEKFDYIIMPRPNLKYSFLKEALSVSGKNTKIIYYGFCSEKDLEKMLASLHKEALKCKKRLKITNIKEAGDIAPYEHRYRVEMIVL
jgi:tRNA G37 N-methylase Trm5